MAKDKVKKKRGKKGKGSKFEREVCKTLSLWWTKGKTDDVFWRTAGSGARAKVRSKTKRATFGQHGDIQATDPIGQPLIDLISIELKRGYSSNTFADLVEPRQHHKPKPDAYELFIRQAMQDAKNAKTPFWMLIIKRDRREASVFIPLSLYNELTDHMSFRKLPKMRMRVRFTNKKIHTIFGTTLSNFLSQVTPKIIRDIYGDGIDEED